jgi:hypothetical protein
VIEFLEGILFFGNFCFKLHLSGQMGDRFSQKLSDHTSTDNLTQLTIEISHRRTPPVFTDKLNGQIHQFISIEKV